MIRTCNSKGDQDFSSAIKFATDHLAPRAPINPKFLEDLEKAMALLIFSPNNLSPSLAALFHPDLRKDIARKVNEAILAGNGERIKSKLAELVRARLWAEKKAREMKRDIPDHIDFGLDPNHERDMSREDSVMVGNGDGEGNIS
jgi:hypothetical protein